MAEWKKVLVSGSSAALTSLSLDTVVNANTDTDKFLVLDSSGNVDFRTGAQVLSDIGAGTGGGDITAVTAGSGLGGGATTGAATLSVNVDDTTVEINSDTVRAKTAAIANGGTALATADQIHTFVTSFGYTTNTGDITGVTAGTGLTGGGNSGGVTLNVSGLSVAEFSNEALTTSEEEFSDSDETLMTAAAIQDKIQSFGYTTNTGDITAVTAGVGLSGGGSSGGVTLTLDMSELTDMTQAVNSEQDELIILDNGADRRKLISEIPLSAFNNDSGFTTNNGDITGVTAGNGLSGGGSSGAVSLAVSVDDTTVEINSDTVRAKTAAIANGGTALATADQIHTFVTSFGYTTNVGDITGVTAGTGLSGGGSSGGVTLAVDLSELEDMTQAVNSEEDELIILDNGSDRRKLISEIPLSAFSNDSGFTTNTGDITGVTAGTGLSGGGNSGGVTLTLDGTELSNHTFGNGTGTITINGNLDVNGTTTTVDTTNLAVADKFIELNRGASTNGDGGIVINGASNRSFGWDDSNDRWAFDFTGASATQTAISTDAFVAAVIVNGESGIAGADSNYQKNGNLMINGSGEIFIYTE